jgi:hypothetical protein
MALGGRSSYDDSAPEEIAGKAKFLGQQIVRRRQVGGGTMPFLLPCSSPVSAHAGEHGSSTNHHTMMA